MSNEMINVPQGEFKVASGEGKILTTILGSCVATCLWDPINRVGGMNHILLPAGSKNGVPMSMCDGVNLMELLVNTMLRNGARKDNIRAKDFGGASMFDRTGGVGEQNQSFALWFLENESVPILKQSIGGNRGRKVRFSPSDGSAQMKFLEDTWKENSEGKTSVATAPPAQSEITLF